MLQPVNFNPFQLENEQLPPSKGEQKVQFLKDVAGIVLWFVLSLNVSLFSRDADNRAWAYLALFGIKGVTTSMAVAKGGNEGKSQAIATSVASITGTIGGLI